MIYNWLDLLFLSFSKIKVLTAILIILKKKKKVLLGTVVHTCSLSHWAGWGGRIIWARELKASLGNIARPCL